MPWLPCTLDRWFMARVRADRIWLTKSGETILLRDPSGPPATPRQDQSAAWIDVLESPGAYAAPEFADPGFACNSLTDIYSLGCLLFRMIAGRLPFSGDTIDAQIAAHVAEAPLELSQALQQGEAGDPVFRVIAYVMAKSPAARFATAQQVSDALKAVLAMIDDQAASGSKIRAALPEQERGKQIEAPPIANQLDAAKRDEAALAKSAGVDRSSAEEAIASPPPVQQQSARKRKPRSEASRPEQPSAKKPAEEKPAAKKTPAPPLPPPARDQPSSSAKPPAVEPKKRSSPSPAPEPVESAARIAPPQGRSPAFPKAAEFKATDVEKEPAKPPPAEPPSFPADRSTVKPDQPGESESSSEQSRVRRRRRKKSKIPFVFGVLSVPVLLLVIGLIVQGSGGDEEKKDRPRPALPERVPTVGQARNLPPDPVDSPPPVAAPAGYELVDDDKLLWVPPYAADSPAASLELLPPGPAVIITVQLSKLMADPLGSEMIEALSPELAELIKTISDRSGVPADAIKRCTVALHAGQEGWPATSLAIELVEAMPLQTLADRWQATASRTPDGATLYSGDEADGDVFFLGDSQQGALAGDANVSRFALGPLEQMREVAANEGGAIPLPRLLDKVWSESSLESDLVALVTPNFLFADGRAMLQSAAPELAEPLKAVLIPDVAALMISANSSGQNLYAEMRVVPAGGVTEAQLMRNISDAWGSLPTWADGFMIDAVPDPSWRLLATRMPLMLRFLVDHTRIGVSDGTVVANAYLPATAATQITLATLLAMNTKPGTPAVSVAATTTTKPLTVEEMLNRKMSVTFDQESLEFGINVVVEQFEADLPDGSTMPKVRILGGDLEKGGITQNQQIRDFAKQDLPLRTVLTDLLLGANPDKTATGPKDPKQALVWVVVPKEGDPAGAEILVTTRAASAGVYELPEEFKPD